jgi:hypothetical protein
LITVLIDTGKQIHLYGSFFLATSLLTNNPFLLQQFSQVSQSAASCDSTIDRAFGSAERCGGMDGYTSTAGEQSRQHHESTMRGSDREAWWLHNLHPILNN